MFSPWIEVGVADLFSPWIATASRRGRFHGGSSNCWLLSDTYCVAIRARIHAILLENYGDLVKTKSTREVF